MESVHDYIVKRQLEIREEIQKLNEQESAIASRREELRCESLILENYDDRGLLTVTTTTTVSVNHRMPNGTRMHIEDAVKKIFNSNGTGMSIQDLLYELEKFNYKWSNYNNGYNFLTRQPYIEKVCRGFYQYRR